MRLRKHRLSPPPGSWWTPALALLVVCPGLSAAATNYTVTQSGFAFSPNALEIAVGDTVTWVWTGGAHSVTSGTTPSDPNAAALFCVNLGTVEVSSFCSNIATVFKHVFTAPGMVPYHCEPHYFFGMTGTVNVTGAVEPPAAVHEVIVRDFEFDPALVILDPGDTVRWVWESGNHTTTSGASSNPAHAAGDLWNSPVDQLTPIFDHVFPDAGLFPYFSVPDESMNMRGAVAVDSASVVGIPDADLGLGLHADPPFPNPTAGSSTVIFSLDVAAQVRVEVFDIAGRLVRTLAEGRFGPGFHAARWEGDLQNGHTVGNGVFFVRVATGPQSVVHKIYRNEGLADLSHHH